MAAANTGGAGTGAAAPAMSPYAQTPFMTMLPHQHSQIHLHHVPQHGDVGQSVTSQRSQVSCFGYARMLSRWFSEEIGFESVASFEFHCVFNGQHHDVL